MKVGIIGLGLIGGSFARAYSNVGHEVLALDTDEIILEFAILSGAVDRRLTRGELNDCDLILICTYPAATRRFMETEGAYIGKKPIVIDCCGTKRNIVDEGFALAEKHGFTYVGGHPMAGTQFSGFKYSKDSMFRGAPMVIVPPRYDDIDLLERIKNLFH